MEQQFFKYRGEKVILHKSHNIRAMKVENDFPGNSALASGEGFLGAFNTDKLGISVGNGIYLYNVDNQIEKRNFMSMNSLQQAEGHEMEVFEAEGKELMIPTNEIIIKFKENATNQEKEKVFSEFGLSVTKENVFNSPNTYIAINDNENKTLDIANSVSDLDGVEYAQPNFIRVLKPMNAINDEFFPHQWALKNTGQFGGIPGNDINVLNAWNKTTGDRNIVIAILDEGVDYAHPDLNTPNKLVRGYDAVYKTNNPSPANNDAHGTACAGIAAAAGGNTIGICGVAPDCRIMGIRIAMQLPNGNWNTTDEIIADGISKSVEMGADVLSNSWGGGYPSNAIADAILSARANGRNGRGCVICFASGNNNGSVSFPGNMREVITVGACNEWGERKSPNSRDGENWWGSNYGVEVDIVAPGVHIATTDISGGRGYGSGDYTFKFNGTSAATPHVAGVAALVLSVNPNLNVDQVERILTNTTDQLTGSGHNPYTGFGRINAGNAVAAAIALPSLAI